MQNAILQTSLLAEARIVGTPSVLQQYMFDPVQNIALNNILVYGIIGYSATQLLNSPQNRPVIAAAGIPSIAITLVNTENKKQIWRLPAYDTVRSTNGGFIVTFDDIKLNLTSSYIELMGTTGVNLGDSFVCNLLYRFI